MADHEDTSPQAGRLAALQSGPGPKRFAWLLSEFLVVVMGVLVAITIDGWWNDRQDREVFERYENLVVAHRNQHYGYEDLRERANQLLALLAEEGIEPGASLENPPDTPP